MKPSAKISSHFGAACLVTGLVLASGVARAAPAAASPPAAKADNPALAEFYHVVQPLLQNHCYDCHAGEDVKGGLALDKLTTEEQLLKNPDLWLKVLRNTRSHIMPPEAKYALSDAEQESLEKWIKFSAFGVNPSDPDPGRQAVRRLNRTEYRNTIKDLLGVDFDTDVQFPADDVGYGFDNIGEVLNVSPLLMEKYLQAAQTVVARAVPTTTLVVPAQIALGKDFTTASGKPLITSTIPTDRGMSFFAADEASHTFNLPVEGNYQIVIQRSIVGDFDFVPGTCRVIAKADGQTLFTNEKLVWMDRDIAVLTFPVHWMPGAHTVSFALTPTSPAPAKGKIEFRLNQVRIEGPMEDRAKWDNPPNYAKYFPRRLPPTEPAARHAYAGEVLGAFAAKAFRGPVPADTLANLVDIAEQVYSLPGQTFEAGVAQAMVATLASPRFIFRIERAAKPVPGSAFGEVDDYALASRLSYFLWSTMPDDELFALAAKGELRQNLSAQVQRMLASPRAKALLENFPGQWLQSREVATTNLDAQAILLREDLTYRFTVTPAMRTALRQETEAAFAYVARGNRSVREFLDCDYIFLNSTLADYYELDPVAGDEMRKVTLPPGDPRGGVLTMGSTLIVTSNPTRTSPVKRGKWVLENILGAPAPPPPPDVPPLDSSLSKLPTDRAPTLREVLAVHRDSPLCASCHDRMDPLGRAMDSVNALGSFRTKEKGQPIDTTGTLYTGERFQSVRELKQILATKHQREFYRCLTEKLLTYGLGRGLRAYDVPTVDKIVDQLDQNDGHFMTLLMGVVESAPFLKQRPASATSASSVAAQ